MAVNPNTGIDPEVDRFLYVEAFDAATFDPDDKSTYRVLDYNESWRADGEARNGANPRFMRFKKLPPEELSGDHRYTIVTTPVMIVTGSLPITDSSLPVGTYQITKAAVKLDAADLKLQVDTEFQQRVRLAFPDSENPATIIEAAGVIARKQNGSPITTKQQALLDSFVGMEDAISAMRARQVELYAAIDADEDYDITEGWITE